MEIIKRILNIIQIPIKIVLIFMIMIMSYSYLDKVFITPNVDYGESYHSLPKDTMDVVVLGSSHAQYSFLPSFLYEKTGLYSYVLGSPCQPLEVSYEMLKEALKTQSPKLVLLEVYTAMPLRKICEADVCYVSAQYQMRDEEKYNTINYLEEEKAKQYYNDFLINHNNWKDMTSFNDLKINKVFIEDPSNISNNFGYVYNEPVYPVENYWHATRYDVSDEVMLEELDLVSINNIYNLCKENDIELMLYKTPIDSMSEEDQMYLNAMWKWADEKGVKYYDFFNIQNEIDYQMCVHSDSFHAFVNGASIITDYLSDAIVENYNFNHNDNQMLNELYLKHYKDMAKNVIKYELDPIKYINLIDSQDIILISLKDKLNNEIIAEKLNHMGINIDEYNSLYAIIKDNQIMNISDEAFEYELDGHQLVIDSDYIMVDDKKYDLYGDLSFVFMDNQYTNDIVKNISLNKQAWEYGYNSYLKS